MSKLIVDLIAAARPNYMKIAPLYHALSGMSWCEVRFVDAGQHYDKNMSDVFLADFNLPFPDVTLGVGSGTHAEQTAGVMLAYETHCINSPPDWIVVVGDVNATLSCALVGAKLCIPVAHLEAGLRSRDRSMPEEINRILTDMASDLLWTPSLDAVDNLRSEGVQETRIEFVGNIMIDAFEMQRERIEADQTRANMGLVGKRYGVVTLHRPLNVDNEINLTELINELISASQFIPLVFPVHPRTRKRLIEFGLLDDLEAQPSITLTEPLGYVSFMNVVNGAVVVITDSGGIQEETSYMGIPCLTLRNNTERPITVTEGSNRLVSVSALADVLKNLRSRSSANRCNIQYWDGHTAKRVVKSLYEQYIKRILKKETTENDVSM